MTQVQTNPGPASGSGKPEASGKPGARVSLARKYRPRRLGDLLGQEALVTMLDAAIRHDRLGQAYILTGVRGVGKTTTARIIARSLNCEAGPTVEPCGTCQSCREIEADANLDVLELDAASRNGVADMRDLIQTIGYAPMRRGARKIYIVDEAHMLSTPAWNALLKTLEEPPAHALFIFATTDPRKIPATIQSRCQRFALRRIDAGVIVANLERIATEEGARLESGVAALMARAAEGSMRDALSILDQAISSSPDGTVSADALNRMLGRGTRRDLLELLDHVVDGEVTPSITHWRAMLAAGADPVHLFDDFAELTHTAVLATLDPLLVEEAGLAPSEARSLAATVAKTSQGALLGVEKLFFELRPTVAQHPNRQQACEIALMRAITGFAKLRKAA